MSSGFAITPSAILTASAGFTDLQSWAQNIRNGLIGSADTYGGMAGDDDAGSVFAPVTIRQPTPWSTGSPAS